MVATRSSGVISGELPPHTESPTSGTTARVISSDSIDLPEPPKADNSSDPSTANSEIIVDAILEGRSSTELTFGIPTDRLPSALKDVLQSFKIRISTVNPGETAKSGVPPKEPRVVVRYSSRFVRYAQPENQSRNYVDIDGEQKLQESSATLSNRDGNKVLDKSTTRRLPGEGYDVSSEKTAIKDESYTVTGDQTDSVQNTGNYSETLTEPFQDGCVRAQQNGHGQFGLELLRTIINIHKAGTNDMDPSSIVKRSVNVLELPTVASETESVVSIEVLERKSAASHISVMNQPTNSNLQA